MADLFATGVASLAATLKAYAGTDVTYRRKDGRSATLTVTLGNTQSEQENDRNLVTVIKTDDVLITTADFETAFGEGERPDSGDVVERASRLFRVRPLSQNEPAWRNSDPKGIVIRVHLKDEGPL